MPLQNRVSPLGDLLAVPDRGLVHGNRGCLHDGDRRIVRRYAGKRWIACRLAFRGWRRHPLMQPGRYTELFFLDEATAMAAGHRACALCRRGDYVRLTRVWHDLSPGESGADAIDGRLHRERIDVETRRRRFHDAAFEDLPEGTFVLVDDAPHLVLGPRLLPWTAGGYGAGRPRPARGHAAVITPPSLVGVLRAGWDPVVPLLHPSARR
ncbi:MAG TPA: hypothetical protein VIB62_04375 [Actinomycetota bacterium]